ncbi:MAG TPA: FHA domain-containing protein [Gemmataceae bacterium]|nr:FHA domain-containing protein [Gemmataceae bacterium]
MTLNPNGELVPEGGGDNIPLIREVLTLGRRESCDICLRYPNVSGAHCELSFLDGFWWIKDLNSTNGIKVNGIRVPNKLLLPGERITIGKKTFTIEYQAPEGKRAVEEMMAHRGEEDILSKSLLERAGLEKPGAEKRRPPGKPYDEESRRITLEEDDS